ncbi:unnamed protein product [Linum tenue]|uniref:Uncharacterized protein n=1 Tax=Linum tenue TaxID=586396 RepID=A0AAV0MCK0_9ROSI|nr:unnamed protein product [Linum tenue]
MQSIPVIGSNLKLKLKQQQPAASSHSSKSTSKLCLSCSGLLIKGLALICHSSSINTFKFRFK